MRLGHVSGPKSGALFPLPVPKAKIFDARRCGSRERRKRAADKCFRVFVMALNFWRADFNFVAEEALCRRPNAAQLSTLRRLRGFFDSFGSFGEEFQVPQSGRRSTSLIAMLADLSDLLRGMVWEVMPTVVLFLELEEVWLR